MTIRHTAFHVRTAGHNIANAWVQRGAFTVPAHYGDAAQEALAARVSIVIADASAREEIRFGGEGAAELLSAAFSADVEVLPIGHSANVFWCTDAGGVRGAGAVSRLGSTDFLLRSIDADLGWFALAAPRFRATVRDATLERASLLIGGPFAAAVLAEGELEEASRLEPGEHAIYDWRQLGVIVFRASSGDYRISCAPDEATLAFDRLFQASRLFGGRLAGQEGLELLDLERGLALPNLDFTPARDASASEPSPASLGLIRSGAGGRASRVLAGIEFESDTPAPFAPIFVEGVEAGLTLRSAQSPALRRAIALAKIAPGLEVGKAVTVRRMTMQGITEVAGRIVALPFL